VERARTVASWARRWGLDVFRYCRRLLGSDAEAEDAMQTVFLQALEDFEWFRGPETERQWLLAIARHRCFDRLKLSKRRPAQGDEVEVLAVAEERRGADEELARSETERALSACLDELPDQTRLAITLRYHEALSYEAIGELTGLKTGALRVRVMRGLARLRDRLERQGISW